MNPKPSYESVEARRREAAGRLSGRLGLCGIAARRLEAASPARVAARHAARARRRRTGHAVSGPSRSEWPWDKERRIRPKNSPPYTAPACPAGRAASRYRMCTTLRVGRLPPAASPSLHAAYPPASPPHMAALAPSPRHRLTASPPHPRRLTASPPHRLSSSAPHPSPPCPLSSSPRHRLAPARRESALSALRPAPGLPPLPPRPDEAPWSRVDKHLRGAFSWARGAAAAPLGMARADFDLC